ncbi:MAG: DUF3089 domain-containing protein [Muribaculaceae bacterium]|nr:DUF3089 domain-containing protein [Muribaculaceae bacterium]
MTRINAVFTPIILALAFLMPGCENNDSASESLLYVPPETDYTSSEMWTVITNDDNGDGADIFYIPSTWEYDWYTADGKLCHYADPAECPEHRADMSIEIDGVAEYMADGNNFYSPYYRHISLDSWATLNEDTISRRYHDVAFVDIQNAFRIFLEKYNGNRPFVLAGFSQGGKSVVELLKTIDSATRERMVAAYVMGYKVTPHDVEVCPNLKGALRNDDTGVVICYNSVSDVKFAKPVVSEPNMFCINPVNWRIDDTPAILDDTITVTLDPRMNLLVVEGYDGSALPNILDILNVGDYHGAEPWLYRESLRTNIRQRIKAFRKTSV